MGGGLGGANVGFLAPSGMPKADPGCPLSPQEHMITLRANCQQRTKPRAGPAILAETESQMPGGAQQPWIHPTPESLFSKPVCF